MIQSVNSASSVSQTCVQQQQKSAAQKPKAVEKPEKEDSVEHQPAGAASG